MSYIWFLRCICSGFEFKHYNDIIKEHEILINKLKSDINIDYIRKTSILILYGDLYTINNYVQKIDHTAFEKSKELMQMIINLHYNIPINMYDIPIQRLCYFYRGIFSYDSDTLSIDL